MRAMENYMLLRVKSGWPVCMPTRERKKCSEKKYSLADKSVSSSLAGWLLEGGGGGGMKPLLLAPPATLCPKKKEDHNLENHHNFLCLYVFLCFVKLPFSSQFTRLATLDLKI
jgi:hypothetical protein